MKIETVAVLIGCVLSVLAVAATDHLVAQHQVTKSEVLSSWACRTDAECEEEWVAEARGERCAVISDTLVCMPIDRR